MDETLSVTPETLSVALTPAEAAPESPPALVIKTEGQRLLRELTDTNQAIADVVGCTRPLVSFWRSGKNKPGKDARQILQARYGIHAATWGRVPGSAGPSVSNGQNDPPDTGKGSGKSTTDLLNHHIDMWGEIASDPETDIELRLRAGELERKCIAERRGVERDARAHQADVVARSPEWANIRRRTLSILRAFPEAFRAWVEAMGELAREEAPLNLDEDDDDA